MVLNEITEQTQNNSNKTKFVVGTEIELFFAISVDAGVNGGIVCEGNDEVVTGKNSFRPRKTFEAGFCSALNILAK